MNIHEDGFLDKISNLFGVTPVAVTDYEGTISWTIPCEWSLQIIIGFIDRTLSIRDAMAVESDIHPLSVYLEGLIGASFIGDGIQFLFEDKRLTVKVSKDNVRQWLTTVIYLR